MNSPIIFITISYILGVIFGKSFCLPILFILCSIIAALGFIPYLLISKKNISLAFLLLFFLIGLFNLKIRDLPLPQNDISNFPKAKLVTIIGQIEDEPRFKEDKAFFVIKVSRVDNQKATGLLSVMTQAAELEYGDRVELEGMLQEPESLTNPGILSYTDYLKDKGINCQLRSTRAPPRVLSKNGGNILRKLSLILKNRLIIIPQKTLPEPYATLLSSIVFGSKAAQAPQEIKEIYKRAGVAHLLVASGMHLGILIGVCLFVVRSARLPLWLGVLITTAVNFIYALMTGFGPSILRAAIMAQIMLVGLLFEREKEVYTSLAIAAFIILLFEPRYLFNVGFQLSFGATFSLVYIAPVIDERLKSLIPRSVASVLSVAIAPVLVSIPITLFHFSQTSVIGVLTNVILLPWIGLIVILGFVATVLGSIFLPLGELINGANLMLLWLADLIITQLAALPFAQLILAPPKFPAIAAYYLGLAGLVEILRRGRFPKINKFRISVIVLALVAVFFWNAALSESGHNLVITLLDMGQGDSILIESPSGKKLLIDGGEKEMGDKVIVPFLLKKGIKKLDLVMLTHPHGDHVGGLPAVLSRIKVGSVLDSGFDYESETYRRFLDLIKQNKIKYNLARAGQELDFGSGVKGMILHPSLPFDEEIYANINNTSIVMRLSYGNFAMIFTGDNEQAGEERILEIFPPAVLAAGLLKAGHHGSRTSTSVRFLEAIKPRYAFISCGRHNKFKHPHQSTLTKFISRGIRVYRTDQDGAVVIKTDGEKYDIITTKTQRH